MNNKISCYKELKNLYKTKDYTPIVYNSCGLREDSLIVSILLRIK